MRLLNYRRIRPMSCSARLIWRICLARIIHELSCIRHNPCLKRSLRLSCPEHCVLKPEAQAKDCAWFASLAFQAWIIRAKDPRGNKLPFLAVRHKPSGAAKPEGLRPTASFNPVIYFRAAPNDRTSPDSRSKAATSRCWIRPWPPMRTGTT